jgi:hypothetical protein
VDAKKESMTNFRNQKYFPTFLYLAELDLLHDALVDYPYGINFPQEQKEQVLEELKLRDVWAE